MVAFYHLEESTIVLIHEKVLQNIIHSAKLALEHMPVHDTLLNNNACSIPAPPLLRSSRYFRHPPHNWHVLCVSRDKNHPPRMIQRNTTSQILLKRSHQDFPNPSRHIFVRGRRKQFHPTLYFMKLSGLGHGHQSRPFSCRKLNSLLVKLKLKQCGS